MALDYDTANTGIFTRIGKICKYVNAHQTMPATTLPAELKAIADLFEAADMTDQIDTIYDDFAGWQDDQVGLRQGLAGYANNVLSDRTSVTEQLGLVSSALGAEFWDTFRRKMTADSESIDASAVSIGTVTAGGSNVGGGTIILSTTLDAYNSPINGGPGALVTYHSIPSELAVTETMTFECVADAAAGATSGAESFAWRGGIAGQRWDYRAEGSGNGPNLVVAGSGGVVIDGNFDNWTGADTPTNWTVVSGDPGLHIFREDTNVFRSATALTFEGVTANASVEINQSLLGRLSVGRAYYIGIRVKCSANAPAAGNFALLMSVTPQNGSPATTTIASIAHGSLTTAWQLAGAVYITPLQALTTATLTIRWNGSPTNGVQLYLDCVVVEPMVYHGGLAGVALPGQTDFVRGDKFTAANTNNGAGVFQTFVRRQFGVQLVSDSGGTETIDDALAT